MAIVEMKHVDMLALDQDRHALLTEIQKLGCFQLLPADTQDVAFSHAAKETELPTLEDSLTRIAWTIGKLNRYEPKKPMMADKPSIDETQADAVLKRRAELMQTVETMEALEREAGELRGQTARIQAAREQLLPWRGFPLAPNEVHSTRNTVAMLGTIPKTALEQARADGSLSSLCNIEEISTQRDQAYVFIVMHRSCESEMQQKLKNAGFATVTLPPSSITADSRLTELSAEQAQIDTKFGNVAVRTEALAGELNALKQLYDLLQSRRARLLAAGHFSVSARTFFLQGWVPAPMIEKVGKRLKKVSPTVALEFYSPAEGEEPPVLLHNPAAVRPFETVVSGYSLPAAGGIDPTLIMMPFFINFMGMMVSDAGYGLMMAILAPILIKVLHPAPGTKKLLWIIMGGGIMTVFWGAMYNSWFGYTLFKSPLDPMNNALPVMALCIGLGAVHLFAGLGIAAYLNIRRGQLFSAVVDQFSWFLLIVGLIMLIVMPAVGKWMAITGAVLIVVFAGRSKTKNPIKRLISGLGALYGVTGWVSDMLSYIRLFGMGLATGVIGMVVNILVGIVAANGVIGWVMGALVFIGGHMFNAGINIFGAYVHSCRLQYIEFFGKFYEDGGKPFTPLATASRYVYVTETQQNT
jgi:V/A-type H+-transporting ATPase subunit I